MSEEPALFVVGMMAPAIESLILSIPALFVDRVWSGAAPRDRRRGLEVLGTSSCNYRQ